MFAAIGNHPHVVNELLNSGASLSLTNINGHSALALAVKNVSFFH
jgi:ankyrin repeat protein